MTIDDIIQQLDNERHFGSRFPVRVIFVEQLAQYNELVSRLSFRCGLTLNLGDYCGSGDVVPKFVKLRATIAEAIDQHALVLSVSEYLRLCIKRELQADKSQFPALWEMQQGASSKTRIIVPLFAARDLFDRIVPTVDERQFPYLWTLEPTTGARESYSISVYSPQFNDTLEGAVNGIGEWLRVWPERMPRSNQALITRLYRNAESTLGVVSVRAIDNAYDYITSNTTDAQKLNREWAPEDFWATLIPDIRKGASFNDTIESTLNVKAFDIVAVLAKWILLSYKQKWMSWAWYQINDTSDYYGYVFRNAKSIDSIPDEMRDTIIQLSPRPQEWVDQRMLAVEALGISGYSEELDTLKLSETRLKLLTYQTHEERAYAIRTVSHWLRKGASIEAVSDVLADRFPQLVDYLCLKTTASSQVDEYLEWYRMAKIINRLPDTSAPSVDLESFDSRFMRMQKFAGQNCFALWIDGMGVEWLPLMNRALHSLNQGAKITSDIVTAVLPTETAFNKQWDNHGFPYRKWNKLDILSHKGMLDDRDYYSCIDYQLSVIQEVAEQVAVYLNDYDHVLVTGDHGSSRLAALAFHDQTNIGIEPPKNAIVRSHGRFCELTIPCGQTNLLPCQRLVKHDDIEFLVMTNYEHFTQSGNAAGGNDDDNAVVGEIHGGMTPEECLVPLVVVSRKKTLSHIDYDVKESSVYRIGGNVTVALIFTCDVSSLEVTAAALEGICTQLSPDKWSVTFTNISDRSLDLNVVANGRFLNKRQSIIVKTKGIAHKDDGLGGI